LGMSIVTMCRNATPEMSGIWTDNAAIDHTSDAQPIAQLCKEILKEKEWNGIYFGGVAFKYQPFVDDLKSACQKAIPYVDVITTSGPGTAKAAHIPKIRKMKRALKEWPLAIASGITSDNVKDYLDHADCFLVASGINKSWTDLDETLVKQLVDKVRAYDV